VLTARAVHCLVCGRFLAPREGEDVLKCILITRSKARRTPDKRCEFLPADHPVKRPSRARFGRHAIAAFGCSRKVAPVLLRLLPSGETA
jgi:hypothetical protein